MADTAVKLRLISTDDHVDLEQSAIKANLATTFHADYDNALQKFRASMGSYASTDANQLWREQLGQRVEQPSQLQSLADRKHPGGGPRGAHGLGGPAAGHGRGRRRGLDHVLRGERVPLPVHAGQRLA